MSADTPLPGLEPLTLPRPEMLGVWLAEQPDHVQAMVLGAWVLAGAEPSLARDRLIRVARSIRTDPWILPDTFSDLCGALETLLHTLRDLTPGGPTRAC